MGCHGQAGLPPRVLPLAELGSLANIFDRRIVMDLGTKGV